MQKGFTLLELIVVIVIVGILATLGYTQYGKMVEYQRQAEPRMIFGYMLKLAYEYRLKNGTINGISNADVNIGTGADQIPSTNNGGCREFYYFGYDLEYPSDPTLSIRATRCTSGGKNPQGTVSPPYELWWDMNLSTGTVSWKRWDTGIGYHSGW